MALFFTKTSISEQKYSFMTPFFTQFVHSHASDNTTSRNIGGDGRMGRPPTSNFFGTVPPAPLSLRSRWFVTIEIIVLRKSANDSTQSPEHVLRKIHHCTLGQNISQRPFLRFLLKNLLFYLSSCPENFLTTFF